MLLIHLIRHHLIRHHWKPTDIARGSLIDNEALLDALADGHIGGASLDVNEPEPLPPGHPVYTHPRNRLSPHTSAIGPHNAVERARKFVRNFNAFNQGTQLEDLVDIRWGY